MLERRVGTRSEPTAAAPGPTHANPTPHWYEFIFDGVAAGIYLLGGTGAVTDEVKTAIGTVTGGSPYRLAGATRYETAAAIAEEFFSTADIVFVATAANFPDALAIGPVAATKSGPVLLTTATALPSATKTQLSRLKPSTIVVVGGTGVVSEAVADELKSYAPTVQRLAGSDRYSTGIAITQYGFPAGADMVYLATGENFPDALSAGAAAAHQGGPVLLTPSASLPTSVLSEIRRLSPSKVVVVGGPAAVSDTVLNAIQGAGITAIRRSGNDRYATSAAIAAGAFPTESSKILFATGTNFPDALAGVPAAAMVQAPVLLVQPGSLPSVIRAEVTRLLQ